MLVIRLYNLQYEVILTSNFFSLFVFMLHRQIILLLFSDFFLFKVGVISLFFWLPLSAELFVFLRVLQLIVLKTDVYFLMFFLTVHHVTCEHSLAHLQCGKISFCLLLVPITSEPKCSLFYILGKKRRQDVFLYK